MPTIARAPVAILPNVGMSQSGLMIASLLAGFVVYLAIKQRLGVYWSILIGGGAAASPQPLASAGSSTAIAPAPSSTTTAPATTTPSNASLGLPSSLGSFFGLGGTASTTASGTVGYNATSLNAASGLTAGSSTLFPGD